MQVQKHYVDTHGQSEIAFAFAYLLGFDLLSRMNGIHKQLLYRSYLGQPDAHPYLQPVLTQPIHWPLICREYALALLLAGLFIFTKFSLQWKGGVSYSKPSAVPYVLMTYTKFISEKNW